MRDSKPYLYALHKSDLRPERYRVRRHTFAIGLAIFWACYLVAMAYGLMRLVDYVTHRIP